MVFGPVQNPFFTPISTLPFSVFLPVFQKYKWSCSNKEKKKY